MPASRSQNSSRSRNPPVATADRRRGIRYALLQTLPGRAVVIGAAIKLLDLIVAQGFGSLPGFFVLVDTLAGLAIAVGAAYFVVRLLVLAKRRLLWRVRRKLMLSYIFIGFIPVLLIVAFFLLCGLLLFYNFSSYLVQSQLHALADRAQVFAEGTALEIQRAGGQDVAGITSRRLAAAVHELRGMSIAVVPFDRSCDGTSGGTPASAAASTGVSVGAWAHVEAPWSLPAWIGCSGFAGLLAYSLPTAAGDRSPASGVPDDESASTLATRLLVRAVAFPDSIRPGYAVVVDLPVDDGVRQQLRLDTGVEVRSVSAIFEEAKPLVGRAHVDQPPEVDGSSAGPLSLKSLLEYHDWSTGRAGTLMLTTQLSIAELYDRISGSQGLIGRSFGQGLLLVLLVIGLLFLIIEFVAFIAGLALARSITGSVHELFVGTERVRRGDFTHKIAVKADDQLGELAQSFNSMTASIDDLLLQAAEKKRMEEELRIARDIQMSLLPQGPLTMPGLSVTALCVPAREVGGDYYDFLPLGRDRVGVLIADVSGKGTSAALYMAELKGLILSLSEIHTSPRALMIAANRIIAANLDARSFITMTYAVIDMRRQTMTYARAGHTPLIYLPGAGAGTRGVQILAPEGMVLGLKLDNGEMFERLLEEQTIPLHAGDLYLFFTDGISEAMNEVDDCFGESRLGRIVEEHAHLPPDELRERVLREIEAFVGRAPQHDDMTLILLKVQELGARSPVDESLVNHHLA